jgi:toxin FitB
VRYLLDTNVVSEWVKPDPSTSVVAWLEGVDEEEVFISVVSFAELSRGVELLPPGRRRRRLERWLAHELVERFEDRLLGVDLSVAHVWGRMTAAAARAGRPLGSMDAFIAATAGAHGMTLATRNVRDFMALGIGLFNPWEPGSTPE